MTPDLRARQLSQLQLTTLIPKSCLFGIKAPSKIAFLILIFLLSGLLGLVASFLGGKFFTDIIFDHQGIRYLSIGFFTVLLLITIRLREHGILATLAQTIAIAFAWVPLLSLLLLSIGWLQNPAEKMIGGILLNALDAGFAILSTVLFAMICQVLVQALPKQYPILQTIFIGSIAAIASVAAAQLSRAGALDSTTLKLLRQTVNPPPSSIEAAVFGALVWTGLIGIGGLAEILHHSQ